MMLSLAGTSQAARAQSANDVKITVHEGFAGNCKESSWIPLQVTVENKGADLNGRVEAGYQNSKGGQSAYGVELSLPGNSRKEFFLYLYPDGYYHDHANVNLTVGDQVITQVPLKLPCIASESLIVGVITDTPAAFSGLGSLVSSNGYTRIASLQIANLPDRPEGWESMDALVISGVDTGAITDAQRKALKGWLAQGGTLLVTGGPKWQSVASGLDEFLPLALTNTQSVDSLSSLQDYFNSSQPMTPEKAILATGQTRAKTTVLVMQGNVPVLVQSHVGFGSVYYLAADPSLQPLSGWDGMNTLYKSLLSPVSAHDIWMKSNLNAYAANQALAALPALGLPPVLYVLCLLGVYILVIGPVNYLILRAIKRQEWAWVTIPAFVLAFTLVAYLSGYWTRGANPILNRLAVVQAWDGVDQAQVRALVGIYSPGRTKYTLKAGEAFLPYPFDSSNQTLQTNQGWLSLQQGSESTLPDTLVEASGMKSASFEGSIPALALTHNLTLNLGAASPTLSGTITNASKFTLKDAQLVTPDSVRNLGDFLPGTTRQLQIAYSANPKGGILYDIQSYPTYYSSDTTDDRTVRQSALMNAVLSGQQANYNGTPVAQVTSRIYLTGWLDDALLPTTVQGQSSSSVDTTFYILDLTPNTKIAPGEEIKLNPGLFSWTSSDPTMMPYPQSYSLPMPENGYILTFKPAVPLQYSTVKSLSLLLSRASYSNSNSPLDDSLIYILDQKSLQWVELQQLVWGENLIADPAHYVGPGGEISIKIKRGNAFNQNSLESSYFTMVVQP